MAVSAEQRLADEVADKDRKKKQSEQAEAHVKHKLAGLKLKLKDLNKKLQLDLNKMAVKFSRDEDHQQVLFGTISAQELVKMAKRLKSSIEAETSKLNMLKRKNNG
jgi:hypothetical protein